MICGHGCAMLCNHVCACCTFVSSWHHDTFVSFFSSSGSHNANWRRRTAHALHHCGSTRTHVHMAHGTHMHAHPCCDMNIRTIVRIVTIQMLIIQNAETLWNSECHCSNDCSNAHCSNAWMFEWQNHSTSITSAVQHAKRRVKCFGHRPGATGKSHLEKQHLGPSSCCFIWDPFDFWPDDLLCRDTLQLLHHLAHLHWWWVWVSFIQLVCFHIDGHWLSLFHAMHIILTSSTTWCHQQLGLVFADDHIVWHVDLPIPFAKEVSANDPCVC